MTKEKSQQQIVFENTCLNLELGDYRHYPIGSIGCIIHWLRAYGLHQYDLVQIGNGEVMLWGGLVATFDFTPDMPVFSFTSEYEYLNRKQKNYLDFRNVFENPFKKVTP